MDTLNVTGYHRGPSHSVAEYKGFFTNEGLVVKFHEATYVPAHDLPERFYALRYWREATG